MSNGCAPNHDHDQCSKTYSHRRVSVLCGPDRKGTEDAAPDGFSFSPASPRHLRLMHPHADLSARPRAGAAGTGGSTQPARTALYPQVALNKCARRESRSGISELMRCSTRLAVGGFSFQRGVSTRSMSLVVRVSTPRLPICGNRSGVRRARTGPPPARARRSRCKGPAPCASRRACARRRPSPGTARTGCARARAGASRISGTGPGRCARRSSGQGNRWRDSRDEMVWERMTSWRTP